jgi:hypothetical protein
MGSDDGRLFMSEPFLKPGKIRININSEPKIDPRFY